MSVTFCARSRSSAERARRRLRAGEEASGFARGTVEEEERVRGLDAGEVIEFVRLAGVGEAAFEPVALGKSDAWGPMWSWTFDQRAANFAEGNSV